MCSTAWINDGQDIVRYVGGRLSAYGFDFEASKGQERAQREGKVQSRTAGVEERV
jgi:hypothetical protein